MASNEITFTLKINEKGNLEGIAEKAQKGAKGLDNVGKSARTADRNLKGAAQASSNSTKNFSKMAQGLGGIVVPAYAAFAAQMFALSAAFEFFKRAGNLKVLEQGQIAYASGTGVAMRSLAQDIQAATGSQIAFTDASQAAAIGIASGLSQDQLVKLGKAAKDTSAILGRDVTDSFNRLVRGVTKAEPELLDELGIVLRLEKAKENYALATGKEAKSLTEFERSQAVANEVLTQAEEKYSRILEVTGGGQVSQFNQLAVALDEIVMKIQKALVPAAELIAKVLTDAPILAGAAFTLLLSGPLKAMGFSLKDIAASTEEMVSQAETGYARKAAAIEKANLALTRGQALAQKHTASGTVTTGIMGKLKSGAALTAQEKGRGISAANKAIERTVGAHTKVVGGMYDGMTKRQVEVVRAALKKINIAEQVAAQKSITTTQKIGLGYTKMGVMAKRGASMVASAGSKLLSALGWVGMLATVFFMARDMFGFGKKIDEEAEAAKAAADKVKGLNKELEHFIKIQTILTEKDKTTGLRSQAAILTLGGGVGQQIGGLDAETMLKQRDLALGSAGKVSQEKFQEMKDRDSFFAVGSDAAKIRQENRAAVVKTDEEQGASDFINRQIAGIDLLTETYGSGFTAFEEYKKALQGEEILDAEGNVKSFEDIQKSATELGASFSAYSKIQKAAEDANKSFLKSLAPMNAAEQAMNKLTAEMEEIESRRRESADGTINAADTERLAVLTKQHAFIKQINDAEHTAAMDKAKTDTQAAKNLSESRPIQKAILDSQIKLDRVVDGREKKEREIKNLKATIMNQGEKGQKLEERATDTQNKKLELLEEQLLTEQAKEAAANKELKLKQDLETVEGQLLTNKQKQFDLGIEKQILDLSKKQLDITKQLNALAEKDLERASKRALIDKQRKNAFSFIGADLDEAKRKRDLFLGDTKKGTIEEDDLKGISADEKSLQNIKAKQIIEERDIKLAMIAMEYDLLEAKMEQTKFEIEKLRIEEAGKGTAEGDARALELASLRDRIADQITGNEEKGIPGLGKLEEAAATLAKRTATSALADLLEQGKSLQEAVEDATDLAQISEKLAKGFASEMTTAFTAMVDGSKSAKDAFKDMASSMLQMITKLIMEMIVLNALKASPLGGFFKDGGVSKDPVTSAYGGVYSKGREVASMAPGGIVSGPRQGYPAVLHGTEAVVPLPKGRSIPVEMRGGGGQVNNINVSVAVDGQRGATAVHSNENQGKQMGEAIAATVRLELSKQKRNGGMLSPYGAS